jgi:voltage-gated potassium channel
MVFAVRAVSDRRSSFLIALVLVLSSLLAKGINHFRPDLMPPAVFLSGSALFFGYVVANLLRFIFCAPKVDANVMCAGVSGYLLLGLLWTPLYWLVSQTTPGAFAINGVVAKDPLAGFDAFYFSFVTLCTVGYGDITAASKITRMLAITEAITGLFYVAVLVSRLVSAYATSSGSAGTKSDGER